MNYSYLLTGTAQDRSWTKEVLVILGASVIIALFAPISFYLPFSPVPIATQSHIILLLAVFLGSKRSAMAVITYLAQGAAGLPVFSSGKVGILCLAGPTGGYLLGYVIAAYATGLLIERSPKRTPGKTLMAMGVGNLTIYLFGLSWLSQSIGFPSAFTLGVLPFLIGDSVKLLAGVRVLKFLRFFRG